MRTITIDILNDKALNLLRDLELLKVIRLRKETNEPKDISGTDFIAKFKGAMTKQPLDEVNKQLHDLRNDWE